MTTPTQGEHAQTALAHELFAAAQLAPGEGIEDAVSRIAAALTAATAQPAAPQGVAYAELPDVDALAQEIRRVDGAHKLGAGALAEALMPFLRASNGQAPAVVFKDWRIDHSAGRPILVYKDCSVIEAEQAELVLGLLRDRAKSVKTTELASHLRTEALRIFDGCEATQSLADVIEWFYASLLVELSQPATTAQAAPAAGAVAGPSLQRLHNLLYTAQITTGEEQRIAINAARVELSNLRSKAAEPIASRLSGEQIEAMPVWRNYVGLWPESRREIVEAVEDMLAAAPTPAAQADSQPAPQGETNVQLDTDSNPSAPGQHRDMAGSVALGQPMGHGQDQAAGHSGAQGDKLLTVAERNIRSFLRSAIFKSESDREAALSCVDVLRDAARAQADSVLEDAARWNEVLMHVGADNLLGGAQYVLRGVQAPVNVMRGSVAQHFTKSIDAERAARKQGDKHDNH